MPDKLRAVEQLAKICGWNEPDKFEHGARAELTELLKRLREDKARSLPAFDKVLKVQQKERSW
jgi:hypothetical protein